MRTDFPPPESFDGDVAISEPPMRQENPDSGLLVLLVWSRRHLRAFAPQSTRVQFRGGDGSGPRAMAVPMVRDLYPRMSCTSIARCG